MMCPWSPLFLPHSTTTGWLLLIFYPMTWQCWRGHRLIPYIYFTPWHLQGQSSTSVCFFACSNCCGTTGGKQNSIQPVYWWHWHCNHNKSLLEQWNTTGFTTHCNVAMMRRLQVAFFSPCNVYKGNPSVLVDFLFVICLLIFLGN